MPGSTPPSVGVLENADRTRGLATMVRIALDFQTLSASHAVALQCLLPRNTCAVRCLHWHSTSIWSSASTDRTIVQDKLRSMSSKQKRILAAIGGLLVAAAVIVGALAATGTISHRRGPSGAQEQHAGSSVASDRSMLPGTSSIATSTKDNSNKDGAIQMPPPSPPAPATGSATAAAPAPPASRAAPAAQSSPSFRIKPYLSGLPDEDWAAQALADFEIKPKSYAPQQWVPPAAPPRRSNFKYDYPLQLLRAFLFFEIQRGGTQAEDSRTWRADDASKQDSVAAGALPATQSLDGGYWEAGSACPSPTEFILHACDLWRAWHGQTACRATSTCPLAHLF